MFLVCISYIYEQVAKNFIKEFKMKTSSTNPVRELFKWGAILALMSFGTIALMVLALGIS